MAFCYVVVVLPIKPMSYFLFYFFFTHICMYTLNTGMLQRFKMCNVKKKKETPTDWAKQQGFFFNNIFVWGVFVNTQSRLASSFTIENKLITTTQMAPSCVMVRFIYVYYILINTIAATNAVFRYICICKIINLNSIYFFSPVNDEHCTTDTGTVNQKKFRLLADYM